MKGQSLLESVIALAVLSVALSSIAVLLISTLKNAGQGKDQEIATLYAHEGIEIVRKIRDSNYQDFKNYSGLYCLDKGASSLSPIGSCNAPTSFKYRRTVNIEQSPGCSSNVAKITVAASWSDGSCSAGNYCHASKIVSCLSKINPIKSL